MEKFQLQKIVYVFLVSIVQKSKVKSMWKSSKDLTYLHVYFRQREIGEPKETR